jgi:VIT1/CCC1 family predicted Fe2+/Mn2+ transporter
VILSLSAWLITSEAKSWAFDNAFKKEEKDGNELLKLTKRAEENANTIQQKDKRMVRATRWVAEVSKEKQEAYNEIKLQQKLSELDQKAISYRLKGKEDKAKKVEKQKDKVKSSGVFDKSFEPYDIRNIVLTNNESKRILAKLRDKKGNSELKSNPKKVNPIMQAISIIVRSATVGITAVMPFVLSESAGAIFWFYIVYAVVMTFTFFTNYLVTTMKMERKHKRALKTTIQLQDDLLEYLDKPQKQIEHKTRRIKNTIPASMKFKLIGGTT